MNLCFFRKAPIQSIQSVRSFISKLIATFIKTSLFVIYDLSESYQTVSFYFNVCKEGRIDSQGLANEEK